jgi:predicted transcriptional regulator
MEGFYDLLFEVSNEYRYSILVLLREKPLRITDIAKQQHLTTQEISRHVSRLGEVGLTYKDINGFYHLSPYGEFVHLLLEEFQFVSKHREYFVNHSVTQLQPEFAKRVGELSNSIKTSSLMEFLNFVDRAIQEAKDYVWLQVDQYPLMALGSIIDALKRGVRFRIIEYKGMLSGPHMNLESMEETQALARARHTPLVEQRTIEEANFYMMISENKCAVAFPTQEGKFDYLGFTASDERSLRWCNDLFLNNWDRSGQRETPARFDEPQLRATPERDTHGMVVVEGQNTELDAYAVQDAVDNYGEVVLKGTFNFGTSAVNIGRSVLIRGEGRKDNIPSTKIYKKGWAFPFTEFDAIFKIIGEEADVTIENIHFTDFNCSCIYGLFGKSLKIKNNMITLGTGYGRGWTYGRFGDLVTAIWLDTLKERLHEESNFPGGVSIEDNYLDLAFEASTAASIPIAMDPFARDPEYRPNLINHEYYIGIGVNVLNMSGRVVIERNTILNMNARGICVTDNFAGADVRIKQNVIKSDEYGSYPFSGAEAGVGIFAKGSFMYQRPGFNAEIEDNVIQLIKPNYCGIGVFGPETDGKGSGELFGGLVRNNKIHLEDGQSGLHISSRNFEVSGNKISGNAYYGLQTTGLKKSKDLDLKFDVSIKDNDVTELKIREPELWRIRRRRQTE